MRSVSGSQTMMNTGFGITTFNAASVDASVTAKESRLAAESNEMLNFGDAK
jgi:hypothetical protein